MSRHTIVLRIGADDTVAAAQRLTGSKVIELPRYAGFAEIDHQLGGSVRRLGELGLQPSEHAFDLAVLAAAMTAADTRVSRSLHAQDGWTREIELSVPVADPARWIAAQPLIERTLNFLTGDRWMLEFRARGLSARTLIPPTTGVLTQRPDSVCLFSGGLDSFIGAIDLLSDGQQPLLVSHYWDGATSKHQTLCLDALKENFDKDRIVELRAHIGFPRETVDHSGGEDTLRGRSFLFFSIAALAADAIGGGVEIQVPENGLISLNVPLDPLRLGALSTRTTHPYYMARFNEISAAIGLTSQLHNRYRHRTKGQMVAECAAHDFLSSTAALTMSCSSPTKSRFSADASRRQPKNCGHCVPCLIRRAALLHGLGGDPTDYQENDLWSHPLDPEAAVGQHIRSFQIALARLASSPGRARFDIHKPGPLIDHPDDWDQYKQVYVEGMQEVAALLEGVSTRPSRG